MGSITVAAKVIGVGSFKTPGYLARDLESPFALLAIWVLGTILALAAALYRVLLMQPAR